MGAAASYILSVTGAAILIGILSSFLNPKSAAGGFFKILGGIVLLIVMIQPVVGFRFDSLTDYAEQTFLEGKAAAQDGKNQTRDTMADIISGKCEAYILDKAGLYQADIQAEVILSEEEVPVPEQAVIRGSFSSEAKSKLEEIIETQLGIPKEQQTWIGTS